jgi:radical SAM protein with 4Fe4S-binding SPASM domain
VYVKGLTRGAIYNFNDGNVYSVNNDACLLIDQIISGCEVHSDYIQMLINKKLLCANFKIHEFLIPEYKTDELLFVWLEITEACNLRCIHCYEGDTHKKSVDALSFEQWKNILFQLKELNCKRIEFIGGEPCMAPYFSELVNYALQLNHKVDIYSNLTLFNNETVELIKKNDIRVHFTLYGDNAYTHDKITQVKGSFDKTIFWIKEMVKQGIVLIPSAIGMRQNQDNIINVKSFLATIGIKNYRGYDVIRDSLMRDSLLQMPTNGIKNSVYYTKPSFYTSKDYFFKAYQVNTCWYGKFSITDNGRVIPCEFCRDLSYGNVKANLISQIIKSEMLQKYWHFDFSQIDECKNCEYRFGCKDCRALQNIKNIYKKNPRCLYNPEKGTWGCI